MVKNHLFQPSESWHWTNMTHNKTISKDWPNQCVPQVWNELKSFLDNGQKPSIFMFGDQHQNWSVSVRPRGFWAFYGDRMKRMVWNLVCCCILITSRNDLILVTVCWFSSFGRNFTCQKDTTQPCDKSCIKQVSGLTWGQSSELLWITVKI